MKNVTPLSSTSFLAASMADARLALVVLDHQLVFAPERAALRVETFNREVRAVVDEGAADRIGAGVDVDDAELDGVLGHAAA